MSLEETKSHVGDHTGGPVVRSHYVVALEINPERRQPDIPHLAIGSRERAGERVWTKLGAPPVTGRYRPRSSSARPRPGATISF